MKLVFSRDNSMDESPGTLNASRVMHRRARYLRACDTLRTVRFAGASLEGIEPEIIPIYWRPVRESNPSPP